MQGIYKILNTVNGKFYIGSAVNIKKRLIRHRSDLNNNKHQNILLQRSWNKHGANSFKYFVMENIELKENLLKREQYWIDITKSFVISIGYNLAPTVGSNLGRKFSEQARKNMSLAKQQMTDEIKNKISLIHKGKKHSEEHKLKISLSGKGRIVSNETRIKISIRHKGKKLSEETKNKLRILNTGKKKPPFILTIAPEIIKNA